MKASVINKIAKNQKGFSLPELLVVLLVLAILVVLALPQMISSRRALRFSGLQRIVATSLTEARQDAMSQRTQITVRYDNTAKKITVHGGKFGAFGTATNKIVELSGSGLPSDEITYGRPVGAPTAALADTANLTPTVNGTAAITFHPDGSVLDAARNPQNNALFFYNSKNPSNMAFAISVLGAGGRVKIWRYSQESNSYVE